MERADRSRPTSVSDEWRANPCSRLVWWWLGPLLAKGYASPLEFADLGALDYGDRSQRLTDKLERLLRAQPFGRSQYSRLWRAFAALDKWNLVASFLCKLVGDLLGFVGPLALAGIVNFAQVRAAGRTDNKFGGMELGYWWLLASFVSALLQNLALQHHHQMVIRAGIRARSAVSLLVYRKNLRLDGATRSKVGNGLIQNLLSTDANAINLGFWFVHYTWAAPLQVAIAIAMLYAQLGPSCFVGLGVLIAMIPIQSRMAAAVGAATKATMTFSDSRVKLINEVVQGIKIIKLFAFEADFTRKIEEARGKEMLTKRHVAFLNAFNTTLLNAGPLFVALLTFLTYGFVSPTPLTAEIAFASLSLFAILRLPMMIFPMLLGSLVSMNVAVTRLAGFLTEPDMVDYRTVEVTSLGGVRPPPAVELSHANLKWLTVAETAAATPPAPDPAAKAPPSTAGKAKPAKTLQDGFRLTELTVAFPTGKLTQIVGGVGAGKSSLLSAILGEMVLESGSVTVRLPPLPTVHALPNGAPSPASLSDTPSTSFSTSKAGQAIAFCSQQPWILNATVRDNIVFGQVFDPVRYSNVIEACALTTDLTILPAGDETEIGERGVNLSGGQKARVSLARAMYSNAAIVLLDDVLSAVDAHVARHIFDHAILAGFRGRTVIMASHQLQFLPACDAVVVMHHGRIVQAGAYAEVMASSGVYTTDLAGNVSAERRNLLRDMMEQRDAVSKGLSAATAASTPASSPAVLARPSGTGLPTSPTAAHAPASDGGGTAAGAGSGNPSIQAGATSSATAVVVALGTGLHTSTAVHPAADEPVVPDASPSIVVEVQDTAVDPRPPTPTAGGATAKEDDGGMGPAKAGGGVGKGVTPEAAAPPTTPATTAAAPSPATAGKLMTEEDRNRGRVPLKVYLDYLQAFSTASLVTMIVSLLVSNAGQVGTDFWLSYWSDNGTSGTSVGYFIGCYAAITVATTLVVLVHMVTWAYGGVAASLRMHNGMLHRVVRSPMSFFDSTPTGRIINRFSGDIETIDKQLPTSFSSYLNLLARIVATIIAQAIVFPWILIAVVPVGAAYWFVQRYYRHSSRELKRLDNISKSPVYAHLAETLSGISTIRAYALEGQFAEVSEVRVDKNTLAFLKGNLVNRWLGLRLDWIGSALVGVTGLVAVLTAGQVEPGPVGLALSYALSVTGLLNWMVRNSTETETYLASVERVETYSQLPVERPPIVPDHRPPPGWPQAGAITFDNVTVTYRAGLPPVLSGITLDIKPGEKIGVVGRTGAGKSSMMLALFRIMEALEGKVVVDGIDVSTLGLDDLRQRLSIIPQDPTLFSGTLRYNLDPTGVHSEQELWECLKDVQMAEYVAAQKDGLAMAVAEGGDNLSVGQRQLVCMARALLRKSRIIVLDEATASTDVTSDAIIQRRLRELTGVTQLTIAHRLNTVLDASRILVLDKGRVAEFAPPGELLANPRSMFYSLVHDSATAGAATTGDKGGAEKASDEPTSVSPASSAVGVSGGAPPAAATVGQGVHAPMPPVSEGGGEPVDTTASAHRPALVRDGSREVEVAEAT